MVFAVPSAQAEPQRQPKRKALRGKRWAVTYPIEVPARRADSQMKLSDAKVIEFLSRSPLKSFAAMLDALHYLDGVSIPCDVEFELFNRAIGNNAEGQPNVSVPRIRGIPANLLLAFAEHAHCSHVVRKRPAVLSKEPEELKLLYELTPSGRYVLKILEALTDASSLPPSQ